MKATEAAIVLGTAADAIEHKINADKNIAQNGFMQNREEQNEKDAAAAAAVFPRGIQAPVKKTLEDVANGNNPEALKNVGNLVGSVANYFLDSLNPCNVDERLGAFLRARASVQTADRIVGITRNVREGRWDAVAQDMIWATQYIHQLMNPCFAAGTPLRTLEGSKSIERFRKGDRLLSRSEWDPNGPVEEREVEEVFVRTGRILHLHAGGQVVRTTSEHPFWVKGQGWTRAAGLMTGDLLSSDDGQWVAVEEVYDTGNYETVYNLRVADHHTYFVGCLQWGFSVWAHNTCWDIPEKLEKTIAKQPGERLTIHAVDLAQNGGAHKERIRELMANADAKGLTYFVFDKKSGEILKVGSTGNGNEVDRFDEYQKWARREQEVWGGQPKWNGQRDLELRLIPVGTRDRARELEDEFRKGVVGWNGDARTPRMKWDFEVPGGIKPFDFITSNKERARRQREGTESWLDPRAPDWRDTQLFINPNPPEKK